MLNIMNKKIHMEKSSVLYNKPFTPNSIREDWNIRGGEWTTDGEWLTGKNPSNMPGMIVSRGDFAGDVMLEFEARTVPPSSHDIDFMWNGSWDESKNERGAAYVCGIEGWWQGKIGFEKSPQNKLTVCTPLFDFEPGRIYSILGGSIHGHCFVFMNGKLALEFTDPDPIDSQKNTKIGFEAYCSHIQIRNLIVREIAWSPVEESYPPEF